jgi:small-conductance mechanosensitive channel
MDQVVNWLEATLGISPETQAKILASLVAVLVLWMLHQLLLRGLIYRIGDQRTRYQWQKTSGYVIFLIGVLVVGPVWFEGLSSLATYLGLLSAGLAIALKDPITDLIGWAFLIWQRPFDVGDRIQVGNYAGDVIDRRIFQFSLMEIGNWVDADQSTGRILHVPNAIVFTSVLANYSRGAQYIWNEIPVPVAYGSNWRKAKELLQKIADEHALVLSAEAEADFRQASLRYNIQYSRLTPTVYTSVKENGVLLSIRYLCEPRQRRDSAQVLWENILDCFAENPDIELVCSGQRSSVSASERSSAVSPEAQGRK